MKLEARLKRNQRIYNWADQGFNAQEISRLLGKRYKLSAVQVSKILRQAKEGMNKEVSPEYVCIICAETRKAKFKEGILHLCKKHLEKVIKEVNYEKK